MRFYGNHFTDETPQGYYSIGNYLTCEFGTTLKTGGWDYHGAIGGMDIHDLIIDSINRHQNSAGRVTVRGEAKCSIWKMGKDPIQWIKWKVYHS